MAALFKKSSIVSAARGRVGGNIFGKGQSGSTIKSARKSVQAYSPESSFQQAALKKIISLWKTGISYVPVNSIVQNPLFNLVPLWWWPAYCTAYFEDNHWYFLQQPTEIRTLVYRIIPIQSPGIYHVHIIIDPSLLVNVSKIQLLIYRTNPGVNYYNETIIDLSSLIDRVLFLELPATNVQFVTYFYGTDSISRLEKYDVFKTKNAFAQIWNSAAQNFTAKNVFGDRRNISGYELFSKLNFNLLRLGQSTIQDPPTPSDLVPFQSLIFAVSSSSLQIRTNVQELDQHTAFLVFLTRPVSKTVDRCRNQDYKQMPNTLSIVAGAIECLPEWSEKFGYSEVPINSKIFCKVKTYDKATGQLLTTTALDVVRLV